MSEAKVRGKSNRTTTTRTTERESNPATEEACVSEIRQTEVVRLDSLRPHPRNYKTHPDDQLDHIAASIRQHGWYRNIVTARDGTILAGHGVALAAEKKLGLVEVPIFRLPINPESPAALKILASDNELGKFAETDDRALTELLRDIKETDIEGLLGTGFDEMMLANLVMVTRPASEVQDHDAAAEWAGAGMPAYEPAENVTGTFRLLLAFKTEAERKAYVERHGVIIHKMLKDIWTAPWPPRPRDDINSLRFREDGAEPAQEKS